MAAAGGGSGPPVETPPATATAAAAATGAEAGAVLQREPLYNWQATKGSLRERFAFLFSNELLSDVHFVVGKGSPRGGAPPGPGQQRIPAHRFVLAAGSAVFDAMFNGGMATTSAEIELPDVEPAAFLALLRSGRGEAGGGGRYGQGGGSWARGSVQRGWEAGLSSYRYRLCARPGVVSSLRGPSGRLSPESLSFPRAAACLSVEGDAEKSFNRLAGARSKRPANTVWFLLALSPASFSQKSPNFRAANCRFRNTL